jgi:diguanylate cyclase (GGDEF)-like protein/PAS domain S-box-containing protein
VSGVIEAQSEVSHDAIEARARVLIVDDEPQVLLAMQDMLGDEFETLTAANGQSALDLARSESDLAVIISDQRMPSMTGDQVLEQAGRCCSATRILFTGYADLAGVIRAVNQGRIFAYVTKPWNAEHLRMTIRQAVEQYSLTRELAQERQLLGDLLNSAPDAIYFKDTELRYLRANPACAALQGRANAEALAGTRDSQNEGGVPELELEQRSVLASGTPSNDLVSCFEREGETRWLSSTHAPIRNERGDVMGLVGIARDITERKRHEEHIARQAARLSFLAHYDELTQLPKRELLIDRLVKRLQANPTDEVALVMLDIDRFRRINVSLGRQAGDALLFEIVSRVRPMLGPDDTLARCDGATFAWLMCDARNASHVASVIEHTLLPRLRAPFELEETELRVSCRIGIALGSSDGDDAEQLIRHAEAALHKAAASNQAYVFYAPIMNERVAERLSLETRLRRAIECKEFVLYYQPKLELKSGNIVGLEALIRWQDPEHGLVMPGSFIPVLEETGLILDVGRWVYREALEQFARWTKQGHAPPPIAVNVSSVELGQSDFLEAIVRTNSEFPQAERAIELEITESVLMDDLHGNIDKLRQVRERGQRVAIDDFGTGYSSLGYLSRLPIDALKVDRSFVMRMAEDPQDMTIVMMIISLAHALDLKVIAEGPETLHQAQLLRLLKCDQIQGYVVARPQPAHLVAELLGKRLGFDPGGALATH